MTEDHAGEKAATAGSRWWCWAELTPWQTLLSLAIAGMFIAAAVYFGGAGLRQLVLTRAVEDWELLAARLEKAELKERRTSEGTLWKIEARYSYEHGGQRYIATTVSADAFSPDDEEAQRERYDMLRMHVGPEPSFRAWVNPDNPAQAVLFREPVTSPWPNIAGGAVWVLFAIVPLLAGVRGAIRLVFGRGSKQ